MLSAIAATLTALHLLGAALGAGGVLFAEIFYTKAIADGRITEKEREYFATTYWSLRWGMTTVLLSGIALIVVQYLLPNSPEAVLYAPLWMQNTLILIITAVGWMLSRDLVSWWVGSSMVFAGWWMILVLDAFQTFSFPYLLLLSAYAVAIFVSAAFWGYARVLARDRVKIEEQS